MSEFYLKKVRSVRKNKGWIILKCELVDLRLCFLKLCFYDNDMVRLKMFVGKEKELLKNVLVDEEKLSQRIDTNLKILNNKQEIIIYSHNLKIVITKDPYKMRILDKRGDIVAEQNVSDVAGVLNEFVVPPIGYSIDEKNNEIKVRETMKLFPEECIYGLGEKFMPINKIGRKLESWASDTVGLNTTDLAYKNVPFLLSTNGYGIFVNTTNKISYDFGHTSSISYSFEIESNELDYFFIYGPDFKTIIRKYTELTGKPEIPPKWSFGVWMSRCMYETRQQAEEIVRKMKKIRIPFDVLHLDPLWLKNRKKLNIDNCCELEWDEKAFPEPKEFIRKLHNQGIKLSLWVNPYVHKDTEIYQQGLKNQWFPTETEFGKNYKPAEIETYSGRFTDKIGNVFKGLTLIDFTNPDAVKMWQEKFTNLLEMGVDTFKPDYGEWAPVKAKYYNGMTGKEMHNLYPVLYHKTIFETVKKYSGRGVVWGRSGYAGSQKYPLQWSGDSICEFAVLPQVLRSGLSYGLSGGAFWSNDVGGFIGTPTPELYIRWSQFGLFISHSRFHGTTPREPWEFGTQALEIVKFYIKLRYRLIPYIYSYAYEANKTGLPVIRPLVLEYQDDPNVYNIDTEYLLGKEILIAPILDASNKRTIYLPYGKWIDYWTKKEYFGPSYIDCYAPLEILPIFIKGDSIIVYGKDREYIDNNPESKLVLDIFIDDYAKFVYQDDSETIKFSGVRNKNKIVFSISKSLKKEYVLNFHNIGKVKQVKINGKNFKNYKSTRNKLTVKTVISKKTMIVVK